MKPELEIQRVSAEAGIPADEEFRGWAEAVLRSSGTFHALTIRIVDEPESRRLNREYRHKDHPTNVLSFVYELPSAVTAELRDGGAPVPLGDLVICAPVVTREASEQGKPLLHHWAHLSVHGILHLLGHDHQDPEQALEMEGLERKLLECLGIPDPYLSP